MSKSVFKLLSIILGVMFLLGCAATKDIEVRRYIEIKDRVDQDMEEGNVGYLMGEPQPEDRSEIRKTRKIYVVEVSKDSGEVEDEDVVESDDMDMEESDFEEEDLDEDMEELTAAENEIIVSYDDGDIDEAVEAVPSVVEYKVQKDDTLQKISKEFYGSYSKWPKIYDMNRDVISDPDKIKPGITLRIPME